MKLFVGLTALWLAWLRGKLSSEDLELLKGDNSLILSGSELGRWLGYGGRIAFEASWGSNGRSVYRDMGNRDILFKGTWRKWKAFRKVLRDKHAKGQLKRTSCNYWDIAKTMLPDTQVWTEGRWVEESFITNHAMAGAVCTKCWAYVKGRLGYEPKCHCEDVKNACREGVQNCHRCPDTECGDNALGRLLPPGDTGKYTEEEKRAENWLPGDDAPPKRDY